VCNTGADIEKTLPDVSTQTLWIACSRNAPQAFFDAVSGRGGHADFGQWLALEPPDADTIPLLQCYFDPLVGIGADFQFLPEAELADVLAAPPDDARDLFIGARVDLARKSIVLIRGNLDQVVVPLGSFWPNQNCIPDPTRFRLTDYGHTVCLGDYEASANSILCEIDPDYRKRARAKREQEEQTFGASLRRVRRLKGLTRDDFAPLSAKAIARLERGEIEKPHAKTLNTIAARLGVNAGEIETY
jgi:hypothetical protein